MAHLSSIIVTSFSVIIVEHAAGPAHAGVERGCQPVVDIQPCSSACSTETG